MTKQKPKISNQRHSCIHIRYLGVGALEPNVILTNIYMSRINRVTHTYTSDALEQVPMNILEMLAYIDMSRTSRDTHAYTSDALEQMPLNILEMLAYIDMSRTSRDTHAYTSDALEQVPLSMTSGDIWVMVPWNRLDTCVSEKSMRGLEEDEFQGVSRNGACRHTGHNH
eukprot:1160970-Pelagomonas_calceolata.AAC.9